MVIGNKKIELDVYQMVLVHLQKYLIKLLQHTNRVLDPNDSKNPYKLRSKQQDGDFGLDPVNMWRYRSKK